MDALGDIARRRGLVLIEDAAQAHAARRGQARAGSHGTGCFSFYATKNMMSGEGGMITTNDAALAARLRRLRSHGESERYRSVEVGFNYRMTELTAAIALAQLHRLPAFTQARARNAAYLSERLRGVGLPPLPDAHEAMVWHQYTVRVSEDRDGLARRLADQGIEAAVYYPQVLPDQPLYSGRGYTSDDLPVARRLAREVLSLPVHPALSEADLERIVDAVNGWAAERHLPLPAEVQAGE
jgi:dTDP-4-amino-4,6-dideoxygalactose transaminase